MLYSCLNRTIFVDFFCIRCYCYPIRIIMGDKMSNKEITCTVSGMRPFKLPKELDLPKLLSRLEEEIRKSVLLGYTDFLTGMAHGRGHLGGGDRFKTQTGGSVPPADQLPALRNAGQRMVRGVARTVF